MLRSSISWLSLALLVSACGCIIGSSPEKAAQEKEPAAAEKEKNKDKEKGAQVAGFWQEKMLKALESDQSGYADAWGLFSEGGWADAGQVIILADKDRKQLRLLTVKPGGKDYTQDRKLRPEEFERVMAQAKNAAALADVDVVSFDGVVFEYVHAGKGDQGKAKVDKRLFVRNPGTKSVPEHDALIAVFQDLRQPH